MGFASALLLFPWLIAVSRSICVPGRSIVA
jgi:hypothetical protein